MFCGINVALKLGYTKINVYGADMALTNDYVHFYSEEKIRDKKLITHYLRSFDRHKKTKDTFLRQLVSPMEINFVSL